MQKKFVFANYSFIGTQEWSEGLIHHVEKIIREEKFHSMC